MRTLHVSLAPCEVLLSWPGLFSVAVIILCLSACGSGGGRMMAPRPTVAEVKDLIGDIGLAADRLHVTDLVATPRSRLFPNVRADASCGGTTCTFESAGLSITTTTGSLSDLSGSTVTLGAVTHGIQMGQARGRSTVNAVSVDYHVYGGWLDANFFGVARGDWSGTIGEQRLNGLETLSAYSTGNESGSTPMSGSATWTGLMVGLRRNQPATAITGRTEAVYSFPDQTMDISMTGLTGGHADMSWEGLRVSDGRFSAGSDANSISGSFYGDAHDELGGVFERGSLIGAFGAKRQ